MTQPALGPLRVLWSYKWWLAAIAIVAGVGAWFISDRTDAVYAATAQVQVLSGRQRNGEYVGQQELLQLTNVSAALANTRPVGEAAYRLAAEELDRPPSQVGGSMEIAPRPQVQILDFRARSGEPEVAAALANAYGRAFGDFLVTRQEDERDEALTRIQQRIQEIELELAAIDSDDTSGQSASQTELIALQNSAAQLQTRFGDSATIIQPAFEPGLPVEPKPARDGILTAIAALVLAALGLSVWDRLRDRYASAEEAAEDLRLPLLGELPRAASEQTAALEAIRSLRTNVAFVLRDTERPLVVTTSATPKAGKTYVSTNLARAFAAEGNEVVVIDGDLRRPSVHERLGVMLHPGIGDLVAGDTSGPPELTAQAVAVSAAVSARGGRLDAVAAGRHVEDPAEALASPTMRRALATLRVAYDVVVVDSPPVLAVADPVVLARHADGVLLVVGARREKRSDVRRTLATLRAVDARVLGLVYNGSSSQRRGYEYYGSKSEERRLGVAS